MKIKIDSKLTWLQIAPILVFTGLVYSSVIHNGFVWDDHVFVQDTQNFVEPTLQSIVDGSYPKVDTQRYRPVRNGLQIVTYWLAGLDPSKHHLIALTVHLVVTSLVIQLVYQLTNQNKLSLLTGIFFGLHPMHTEAVAWIIAGYDQIFVIFYLLAVISCLDFHHTKKPIFFITSIIWGILAIFSHELAHTLPLVILLTQLFFKDHGPDLKKFWASAFPYFVIVAVFWLIRLWLAKEVPVKTLSLDWGYLVGLIPVAFSKYLQLLSWPWPLSVNHHLFTDIPSLWVLEIPLGLPLANPNLGQIIPQVMVTLLFLTIAVILRKKQPLLTFALLWMILTLLPVLQIIPTKILFAERYAYLASVGFCLALAIVITTLYSQLQNFRKFTIGLVVVITASYTILVVNRVPVWHSDLSLFSYERKLHPNSLVATSALGGYYYHNGNYDLALENYELAFNKHPYVEYHKKNIIKIYTHFGYYDKLLGVFNLFLQHQPNDPQLLYQIGQIYETNLNDLQNAHKYYRLAYQVAPNNPQIEKALVRTQIP